MRKLLVFLSAFPLTLFAQMSDLEPKESRIIFEPLVSNTIIKDAGIKKERIYKYTTRIKGILDSTLTEEIIYDDQGYAILKKEYTGKTIIQKKYNYTFYSSGQLSLLRIETKTPKHKTHFTEISYNASGNEVTKIDYDGNHENKITLLKEYNEKNLCTFLKYLNIDNNYYSAKAYHYDAANHLEKTEIFIGNHVTQPAKVFLYKNINEREVVYLIEKNNEQGTEVASFVYNLNGECTAALVQQNNYKSYSSFRDGDYEVSLSNNRSQGVNNTAETYIVSGSSVDYSNIGNTIAERTGAPQTAIGGNDIYITPVMQERSTNVIVEGFTSKNFSYNMDGTLSSEVSNDIKQIVLSKKHYYYH